MVLVYKAPTDGTLNITVNKQFVEKSAPVKDGDEIALVGFAMA